MAAPTGLSFEQAPPFGLPLRFFLTAPLFLFAAGVLIALAPDALVSRWTPEALALTHALTLGFLAMVMLGALAQMLPVVAGSPLPRARLVASVSHAALATGTLALMAGFLTGSAAAYGLASVLLGSGLAVFLGAAGVSVARAPSGSTVNGIRLALLSLGLTLALGLGLALMRAGIPVPLASGPAATSHLGFGLLGWVLLLVVGVAYQVVPMFQITPPYPPRLSRWLAAVMFGLLLLLATAPAMPDEAVLLIEATLGACILLFAIATLHLQSRRRRKLPDVTLDYWRLGMISLIASVAVWAAGQMGTEWAASDRYPMLLGLLFIGGFSVSVVVGMLYKIVPFLAWFHLQAQLQARAGSIPTMKEMIDGRWLRAQFSLHLGACLLLVFAVWLPVLARLAGGVLALSALLLALNLTSAVRRFIQHGGRLA